MYRERGCLGECQAPDLQEGGADLAIEDGIEFDALEELDNIDVFASAA